MKIFKYRLFERWATRQGIKDDDLRNAIMEIENGLCDASLGGNVYKKRISRLGQGKRSSYRTILLMRQGDKVIFAHGFGKGKKTILQKMSLKALRLWQMPFLI